MLVPSRAALILTSSALPCSNRKQYNLNFLRCKLASRECLLSFPVFNIYSARPLLEISFIFLEIACIGLLKGTVFMTIFLSWHSREKSTADLLPVVTVEFSSHWSIGLGVSWFKLVLCFLVSSFIFWFRFPKSCRLQLFFQTSVSLHSVSLVMKFEYFIPKSFYFTWFTFVPPAFCDLSWVPDWHV